MNYALNPKAINANRAGRLTLIQALGQLGWVLFGAFLFLPGALMFAGFIYNLVTHVNLENIIFGVIFNIGFAGALMWFGYLLGGRLLIDMILGQVRQTEGTGMKYSGAGSGKNSGRVYYYSVGDLNFQIPSYSTYKALHDGNMVRAYYLPRSKTLVNVEFPYSQPSYSRSNSFSPTSMSSNKLQKLEEAEKKAKNENKRI
jgi:hypothetical protein